MLVENIRNLVRKSQRKRYVLIIGISRRIILALTLSIREGKRTDQESPAAEILMTVTAVQFSMKYTAINFAIRSLI